MVSPLTVKTALNEAEIMGIFFFFLTNDLKLLKVHSRRGCLCEALKCSKALVGVQTARLVVISPC